MISTGPLDGLRAGNLPAAEEDTKLPPGSVDEADIERLHRVVGRRDDQGGQREDNPRQEEIEPAAQVEFAADRAGEWRSAGDQILFSLGLRPTEVAPVEPPRSELAGLVDQVAERVLVGTREDGTMELRITLKDTALLGSELRIARADGGLQVQILATAAGAAVMERHGAQLAHDLATRLATRVVVEMLPAPGEGAADGGASDQQREGRSRGLEALLSWAAG
jgi:type III secretion system needle length determinant